MLPGRPMDNEMDREQEHGVEGTETVKGRVKWFDPSKGFGFVVAEEGGDDILLHANVLRNFGQSSVADGARVEITVQRTARGMQAVSVLRIEPPEQPAVANLPDIDEADASTLAGAPLEPARVKWFDKVKGFGFANVFGLEEDVFIHIEVLRRSGLSELQPGEAVCLRTMEGRRGRMALEVLPWDAANQSDSEQASPV